MTFILTTYDSTKFSWTANQDLPSLLILHLFVIRRSLLFIDISQQSYQGFHYNLPGGWSSLPLVVFFSDFKSCDLIIIKRNLFPSSKCLASNFRTILHKMPHPQLREIYPNLCFLHWTETIVVDFLSIFAFQYRQGQYRNTSKQFYIQW